MEMEEFEQMVVKHGQRLKAIAKAFTPPSSGGAYAANVDDNLQIILMRLWDKRNRFKAGTNFGAWSAAVATNVLRSEWRKNLPHNRHTVLVDFSMFDGAFDPWEPPCQENDMIRKSREDYLTGLMQDLGLSEGRIRIFALRYFHGLEYTEISRETGAPMGTVMSSLNRARNTLINHLENNGIEL